jgi:glucosylceramidase
LTNFTLTNEDVKWKIPFVQKAIEISRKPLKMFASAWTAPPWMKTNNDYKGNGSIFYFLRLANKINKLIEYV